MDHLTKNTGLDVNSMKIDVTSVQYHGEEAVAAVSFQPKNMPGGGMTINYTLESKGNKWTVKKKAGSGMGGAHPGADMPGQMPSGQMPSGHPSMGDAQPSGALPPGHPPMSTKPAETPAKK